MKKILICVVICLLSACSSFKPDYVVKDASLSSRPSWLNEPIKAAKNSKEEKEFLFYVGNEENVNKNLCITGSSVRATTNLGSVIMFYLKNLFIENNTSQNNEYDEKVIEELKREIDVYLSNVSLVSTYWEKRAYLIEMGATEDVVKFNCTSVVKMPIKNVTEMIKRNASKMSNSTLNKND